MQRTWLHNVDADGVSSGMIFIFYLFVFFLTSSAPGMDILNGAIDSLIGSSNREDWTPVALNVADATVTISKEKVKHTSAPAERLPPTSPGLKYNKSNTGQSGASLRGLALWDL